MKIVSEIRSSVGLGESSSSSNVGESARGVMEMVQGAAGAENNQVSYHFMIVTIYDLGSKNS